MAVPDMPVLIVEVARMVRVAAVSFAATASTPADEMVVPVLFLPVIVHVTVCAGSFVPFTTAANCCVEPCLTTGVMFDAIPLETNED